MDLNLDSSFLFNEYYDNLPMELNKDNEIQISEESEAEIILSVEESSSSIERPTTKIKEKHTNSSLTYKRRYNFKREWLKDPKYSIFL